MVAGELRVGHDPLHEVFHEDEHLLVPAKLVIQGRLIVATDLGSCCIGSLTKRLLGRGDTVAVAVIRHSLDVVVHEDILRSCKHILVSLCILFGHDYLNGCKLHVLARWLN